MSRLQLLSAEQLLRGDVLSFTHLEPAQLRAVMLEALGLLVDGHTNRSEQDPAVALIEALVVALDQLGHYHDRALTEARIRTAHRLASIRRLADIPGVSLLSAYSSSLWQHFQVSADVQLPAGAVVSGADRLTGPVVFETTTARSLFIDQNRIQLAPIVTLRSYADHLVLDLREEGSESRALSSSEASSQILTAERDLPGDALCRLETSHDLELIPIRRTSGRQVFLGSPSLRSWDLDETVLTRHDEARRVRVVWRLPRSSQAPRPDTDPMIFPISDGPVQHLQSPGAPGALCSSLQLYVVPPDQVDSLGMSDEYRWEEVVDFSSSRSEDWHYRTFRDHRLRLWGWIRAGGAGQGLRAEQIRFRYSPALESASLSEPGDTLLSRRRTIWPGLLPALVTGQAGAEEYTGTFRAAPAEDLKLAVGEDLAILFSDGRLEDRTITGRWGRVLSWEAGAELEEDARLDLKHAKVAGTTELDGVELYRLDALADGDALTLTADWRRMPGSSEEAIGLLAGTTILSFSREAGLEVGDRVVVGLRLSASGDERSGAWLRAEIVQVAEVIGSAVRLMLPLTASYLPEEGSELQAVARPSFVPIGQGTPIDVIGRITLGYLARADRAVTAVQESNVLGLPLMLLSVVLAVLSRWLLPEGRDGGTPSTQAHLYTGSLRLPSADFIPLEEWQADSPDPDTRKRHDRSVETALQVTLTDGGAELQHSYRTDLSEALLSSKALAGESETTDADSPAQPVAVQGEEQIEGASPGRWAADAEPKEKTPEKGEPLPDPAPPAADPEVKPVESSSFALERSETGASTLVVATLLTSFRTPPPQAMRDIRVRLHYSTTSEESGMLPALERLDPARALILSEAGTLEPGMHLFLHSPDGSIIPQRIERISGRMVWVEEPIRWTVEQLRDGRLTTRSATATPTPPDPLYYALPSALKGEPVAMGETVILGSEPGHPDIDKLLPGDRVLVWDEYTRAAWALNSESPELLSPLNETALPVVPITLLSPGDQVVEWSGERWKAWAALHEAIRLASLSEATVLVRERESQRPGDRVVEWSDDRWKVWTVAYAKLPGEPLGEGLRLSPAALLSPGDRVVEWSEARWWSALAQAPSGDLERPWRHWPDRQHVVVVAAVDEGIGAVTFTEPLPESFTFDPGQPERRCFLAREPGFIAGARQVRGLRERIVTTRGPVFRGSISAENGLKVASRLLGNGALMSTVEVFTPDEDGQWQSMPLVRSLEGLEAPAAQLQFAPAVGNQRSFTIAFGDEEGQGEPPGNPHEVRIRWAVLAEDSTAKTFAGADSPLQAQSTFCAQRNGRGLWSAQGDQRPVRLRPGALAGGSEGDPLQLRWLWRLSPSAYALLDTDYFQSAQATALLLPGVESLAAGNRLALSRSGDGVDDIVELVRVDPSTGIVELREPLGQRCRFSEGYLMGNLAQVFLGRTERIELGTSSGERHAQVELPLSLPLMQDEESRPLVHVEVGAQIWTWVPNLAVQSGTAPVFTLVPGSEGGVPILVFGDGESGARLPAGRPLVVIARVAASSGGAVGLGLLDTLSDGPGEVLSTQNVEARETATGSDPSADAREQVLQQAFQRSGLRSLEDIERYAASQTGVADTRLMNPREGAGWLDEKSTEHRGEWLLIINPTLAARPRQDALIAEIVERITRQLPAQAMMRIHGQRARDANLSMTITVGLTQEQVPSFQVSLKRDLDDPVGGFFSPQKRRLGASLRRREVEGWLFGMGAHAVSFAEDDGGDVLCLAAPDEWVTISSPQSLSFLWVDIDTGGEPAPLLGAVTAPQSGNEGSTE